MYFVRVRNCELAAEAAAAAAAAPPPVVQAALHNFYAVAAVDGMYRASRMDQVQETRLVCVDSMDSKFAIARPKGEEHVAYFLPYSNVSGMR